ncbi:hypothetical protein BJ546DRAFT_546525 [Cryomyces antarcticus]
MLESSLVALLVSACERCRATLWTTTKTASTTGPSATRDAPGSQKREYTKPYRYPGPPHYIENPRQKTLLPRLPVGVVRWRGPQAGERRSLEAVRVVQQAVVASDRNTQT